MNKYDEITEMIDIAITKLNNNEQLGNDISMIINKCNDLEEATGGQNERERSKP